MQTNNLIPYESERNLLGIAFMRNDAVLDALEIFAEINNPFGDAVNAAIWQAMFDIYANRDKFDVRVIHSHIKSRNVSLDFLLSITNDVTNPRMVKEHANIVSEFHRLRLLMKMANAIKESCEARQDSLVIANDFLRSAGEILHGAKRDEPRLLSEILLEFTENLDSWSENGIQTGFTAVDNIIGRIRTGNVAIVAARPSIGKTTYAAEIAMRMTEQGKHCLFISAEMNAEQIIARLVTRDSGIDVKQTLTSEMRKEIILSCSKISKASLTIDDRFSPKFYEIKSLANRFKSRKKLDFLIVDYIGLLVNETKYQNNYEREVAELSRNFKALAKDLDIPVIVLSQLNRALEHRTVKRPMLADLRSSGSLEADADIVMLLHRDIYAADVIIPTEVIIAKNRHGSTGQAMIGFDTRRATFVDASFNPSGIPEPPQSFYKF